MPKPARDRDAPTELAVESARPSERVRGVKAVLSLPWVYRSAQGLIGADRFRRYVVDELLRPAAEERVIDIGCGTADILADLPPCDYIGIDHSSRYVEDAQRRFGSRGHFMTASAAGGSLPSIPDRDVAMMIGVLHHLDDEEATAALQLAAGALRPGGRFVSIDPTFTRGQHRVARWLAARDRGEHVRSPEAMRDLVDPIFATAEIGVRHDLLRVPYSHVTVVAHA